MNLLRILADLLGILVDLSGIFRDLDGSFGVLLGWGSNGSQTELVTLLANWPEKWMGVTVFNILCSHQCIASQCKSSAVF